MDDAALAGLEPSVDEYLTKNYDGRRRALLSAPDGGAELAAEFAGLGWYALAVPEAHGGLGAPLAALGPVFVQFGRHLVGGPQLECALLPALLLGSAAAGLYGSVQAATESGAPIALVDPGITDDWAADIGAVTCADGRLSGAVSAVRQAGAAQLLVVLADGVAGPGVWLVDRAQPGVRVETVASADPGTQFGRVRLDAVRAEQVGTGDLVARIRAWARLLIACELSGMAGRCVELAVAHVSQREQFGRAIGSFQAVQHLAADMLVRATGLDNLSRACVADASSAPLAELEVLAWTAKAHAAEVAVGVCQDAIQLHGGMGFTTEGAVSWYYRRALALRAWYGDETELHRRIGMTLLERA